MTIPAISKQALIDEAWRRGAIAPLKLTDRAQRDFHSILENTDEKTVVILSSRRIGKTVWSLTEAVMTCLKTPNAIVKFLAPTRKDIMDILEQIMPIVLEGCPEQYRPVQLKSRYTYRFYNNSKIQFAGCDSGNAEKVRGNYANLCIVDEAGVCNDLGNTVRSVLVPTTMSTGGKIILLGTPPKDLEHDFMKFVERAEARGTLSKRTIEDSDRYTKEQIDEMAAEYPGGYDDPDFRREFYCELHKDPKSSAFPEFTERLEKEIVREWKRPGFYDIYEGMDLGFKDLTVVLFAYYDFTAAKVIVEDELVVDFQEEEANLRTLVEKIHEKEKKNFTDPLTHEVRPVKTRVSDIDLIALREISIISRAKINFMPIDGKEDKDAMVNQLRRLLNEKKIIINPRCVTLLRHLRNAKWAKGTRAIFERSKDNFHYDAVDALIYLTRKVIFTSNPYPAHHDMNPKDLMILGNQKASSEAEIFRKIFKIRN